MVRSRIPTPGGFFILAVCFAAFSGCSNKDEDTVTTLDQGTAQQQALGAVEVVNGMVASVDEVSTGDFTNLGATIRRMHGIPEPRSSAAPIYDDQEGRWEYLETYNGPEGSFAYAFTIRFENGDGGAMMNPDSTTSQVAFGLVFDLASTSTQSGDDLTLDLHYETGLDISDLQTSLYDVAGAGSLAGSVEGTKDGQRIDYDLAMTWGVDLAVPEDGSCASGGVSVTIEPYTLVATYEAGSQTYAWSFTRGGTQVSNGTGTAPCASLARPAEPLTTLLLSPE